MATAAQIISKAQFFIGTKESPAGSNCVIFNTDYYGKKVSGSGYAWCCAFVWDIFRLCGASALFNKGAKTAYCPAVEAWGKVAGQIVDKRRGKPGDIILFDFSGCGHAQHIGIIEKANDNGTYSTIEGNTSLTSDDNGGCVMRRTRKQLSVRCIVRPKYEQQTVSVSAHSLFVKSIQAACGAKIDGIAGPETLSKTVTLSKRKNTRHAAVRIVQTYLNKIGYDCGKVDGGAGKLFDAAVKSYQKKNGCVVDGEITARGKTWRKLLGLK